MAASIWQRRIFWARQDKLQDKLQDNLQDNLRR
jgi:hypothetical protein